MAKVFCANCDWTGEKDQTGPIRDVTARVAPGEQMPAGECPECGSLCHLETKGPKPVASYRDVPVFLGVGASPKFYATAAGKRHVAGSFDTLRKKLDAALVFEPFEAATIAHGEVLKVQIIGLDMERGAWVLSEETRPPGHVGFIKFYQELFPVSMADELETYLGEREEWDRREEEIKEARAAEQARLRAKRISKPDGA